MSMEAKEIPKDGDDNILHELDRVWTYDLDGSRIYGTLIINDDDYSNYWCIVYDDGETFIILDFTQVFKA